MVLSSLQLSSLGDNFQVRGVDWITEMREGVEVRMWQRLSIKNGIKIEEVKQRRKF